MNAPELVSQYWAARNEPEPAGPPPAPLPATPKTRTTRTSLRAAGLPAPPPPAASAPKPRTTRTSLRAAAQPPPSTQALIQNDISVQREVSDENKAVRHICSRNSSRVRFNTTPQPPGSQTTPTTPERAAGEKTHPTKPPATKPSYADILKRNNTPPPLPFENLPNQGVYGNSVTRRALTKPLNPCPSIDASPPTTRPLTKHATAPQTIPNPRHPVKHPLTGVLPTSPRSLPSHSGRLPPLPLKPVLRTGHKHHAIPTPTSASRAKSIRARDKGKEKQKISRSTTCINSQSPPSVGGRS